MTLQRSHGESSDIEFEGLEPLIAATYDAEADAYYFGSDGGPFHKTRYVGHCQVLFDYDPKGRIIAVEILVEDEKL